MTTRTVAWLPIVSAVSATAAAVLSGYISISTSQLETSVKREIVERQAETQKKIADLQEQTKLQLSETDASVRKEIIDRQAETQRKIADLQEQTKLQLGETDASVRRAELFANLIGDLQDHERSSFAILALWQLYMTMLKGWMQSNGIDTSITFFLYAETYADLRGKAVNELELSGAQTSMIKDVPENAVSNVVNSFLASGFVVETIAQPDGKWTVRGTIVED